MASAKGEAFRRVVGARPLQGVLVEAAPDAPAQRKVVQRAHEARVAQAAAGASLGPLPLAAE